MKNKDIEIDIKLVKKTGNAWLKYLEENKKDKEYMKEKYILLKEEEVEKLVQIFTGFGAIQTIRNIVGIIYKVVSDVNKVVPDAEINMTMETKIKDLIIASNLAHISGLQKMERDMLEDLERLEKEL